MRSILCYLKAIFALPDENKYMFPYDKLHPLLWLHMSTTKQTVDLSSTEVGIYHGNRRDKTYHKIPNKVNC